MTFTQEYADYLSGSWAVDVSEIRPTEDTGFRMPSIAPFIYKPRRNPPTKSLLDHVHSEDIATREESPGLRGVFYITINEAAARARLVTDIQSNIANTN